MRCPKCGYISFDHMESCLKCKKDISKSTEVEGTTYHAVAPSFLRVPERDESVSVEGSSSSSSMNEEFGEEDYSFSDPDLDILVDEDDEGTIAFHDSGSDSDDFRLESDEESEQEGDFEFDLDANLDFSDEEQAASPALNVPDELADISDLAPPVEGSSSGNAPSDGMSISLDDDLSLDEDLDLDGLDLDLGLRPNKKIADSDLSLSLDDIDLSVGDIVEESSELDELDMDLGLSGLDETPKPKKEKSSGSLDGISLSLD